MNAARKRRTRRSESGNSILEFALGSGLLVSSFVGISEFGFSFYIYDNLQTAVNNGAKYAALRSYEPTTDAPEACFQTAVQDMVAYGDPTGGSTTPVAPGLTPEKVFVTVTFANGVPSQMTVGILSYTINSGVGKITLTNKPQVTYPYLGRYAEGDGETCTP